MTSADGFPRCPECGAPAALDVSLGGACAKCLIELAMFGLNPDTDPDPFRDHVDAGRQIGPYLLVKLLGEGGMGTVWLAEQRHPIQRQIALKLLKRGLDAALVARFNVERQMLALLSHEHIAKIFDAGLTADGRPFFAMEHVTGTHIIAYADEVRASVDERLELFLQVCEAVQHAHQRGVIHRDLKPSNILVTDVNGCGSVKVIDFGIAKVVETSQELSDTTPVTQIGMLVGTPEYMSPEQAGVIDTVIDTRTDVYSLGIVLYELLSGGGPFDLQQLRQRGPLEMLRVLREEAPPRLSARVSTPTVEAQSVAAKRRLEPRALVRRLRGDLDWIVAQALEKDPARRYPAVSELSADLRRHLRSEPIVARPPQLRYRLGKFVRRHKVGVSAAGAVLLAIVCAAVISTVSFVRAERARRETRASLNAFHVSAGLRLADDGDDLLALPWFVRALELEENGSDAEEGHRVRIGHLMARVPLPVRTWSHKDLVGAAISADRGHLLTWDREGEARVWETSTGRLVGPPLRHQGAIIDARVANEAVVATADSQGVIRVWNARAGSLRYPAMTHGRGLTLVRIADGSPVLSADAAGGLKLWTNGVPAPTSLPTYENKVEFAEFLGNGEWIATSDTRRFMLTPTSPAARARGFGQAGDLVSAVHVAPDTVITTERSGRTSQWDLRTGVKTTPSSSMVPNGVRASVSRVGDVSVVCGLDGAATVRRDDRPVLGVRMDAGRACHDADLSSDETWVATGHTDGNARVWSWAGQPVSPRLPLTAGVVLVRFLADARYLLGVDAAGVIRVWDLAPATRAPRVGLGYTWTSDFSPEGRRLAMASGTSTATPGGIGLIVDARTLSPLTPPLRHAVNVRGIAFSPDGKIVATVAQNGAARFWDSSTGEPLTDDLPHEWGGRLVSFSPDGQLAMIESFPNQGGAITLRRVPGGEFVARVPPSGPGMNPDVSPDSRHAVATEFDRLRVWRLDRGAIAIAEWTGYESARFLDRATLVAVGRTGIARLGLDGRILESHPTVGAGASPLVLSADRSRIAWIVENGRVEVWSTRPTLSRLSAAQISGTGLSVALSPDGRHVAAASAARVARVWSVAGGDAVTPERPLLATPLSVTFSLDSRRVQISGTDADVWSLEPDTRPVMRLRDLAAWLSAHEIDGTRLVPLVPDRLVGRDDLARTTSADERRWGAYTAAVAIRTGRWAHAAAAFEKLVAASNAGWNVWAGLGTALAEQGRWREASDAFDRAFAERPDSTELLFLSALSHHAGGDARAIDARCREGLARHGATKNEDRARWLARLCACAPTLDPADDVRVRELIGRAPVVGLETAVGERQSPWFLPIETKLRRLPLRPPRD
jgi:serine/threonine protein kinase/WD40 repeat protein